MLKAEIPAAAAAVLQSSLRALCVHWQLEWVEEVGGWEWGALGLEISAAVHDRLEK